MVTLVSESASSDQATGRRPRFATVIAIAIAIAAVLGFAVGFAVTAGPRSAEVDEVPDARAPLVLLERGVHRGGGGQHQQAQVAGEGG